VLSRHLHVADTDIRQPRRRLVAALDDPASYPIADWQRQVVAAAHSHLPRSPAQQLPQEGTNLGRVAGMELQVHHTVIPAMFHRPHPLSHPTARARPGEGRACKIRSRNEHEFVAVRGLPSSSRITRETRRAIEVQPRRAQAGGSASRWSVPDVVQGRCCGAGTMFWAQPRRRAGAAVCRTGNISP
jgi:hypothetical protein